MSDDRFSPVDHLLHQLVAQHAFPGAVALVADASGLLHAAGIGRHTYDGASQQMTLNTHFDVASLTKVLVTTTICMLLYQFGVLDLKARVTDYLGPAFASSDARKAAITVEHLLLHSAGFPPDPTPDFCTPQFACPELRLVPAPLRALTFSCQRKAIRALSTQHLATAPGERYVYSDLSMLSMMAVIGEIVRKHGYVQPGALLPACVRGSSGGRDRGTAVVTAKEAATASSQCFYEAFARERVLSRVTAPTAVVDGSAPNSNPASTLESLPSNPSSYLGFRLPPALWPRAAPTWNDTKAGFPGECGEPFRERVLQGEVSDGNAFALGGVAGHAGLFATGEHVLSIVQGLLFASEDGDRGRVGVNASTVRTFTRVHNASFSSRAYGWDTLANSQGQSLCGNMSAATFMHTGYTGTMVCADPEAKLISVLLTNRVYPRADAASERAISAARRAFSREVLKAVHDPAEGARTSACSQCG